uniref:Transmembrane protein n=1 Tax=Chromera velia CCMP2878 TaxID=1169474 RepID=A0A0G4GID1_9ALVE|eukprot:Cvel_22035.t1-p1 / transcript=Cvel_22035.t1 / gene=Cvel_22035 / organism=Chromera_velia_CCMP2878 / gene_product=hypothetical protein / transcript_product=hypothetical protein / location=Cvel_scaffold2127:1503-3029(-) / protein_length=406 / sequence_SO=supercontig / SO=protein_coding / is_pseudo=false
MSGVSFALVAEEDRRGAGEERGSLSRRTEDQDRGRMEVSRHHQTAFTRSQTTCEESVAEGRERTAVPGWVLRNSSQGQMSRDTQESAGVGMQERGGEELEKKKSDEDTVQHANSAYGILGIVSGLLVTGALALLVETEPATFTREDTQVAFYCLTFSCVGFSLLPTFIFSFTSYYLSRLLAVGEARGAEAAWAFLTETQWCRELSRILLQLALLQFFVCFTFLAYKILPVTWGVLMICFFGVMCLVLLLVMLVMKNRFLFCLEASDRPLGFVASESTISKMPSHRDSLRGRPHPLIATETQGHGPGVDRQRQQGDRPSLTPVSGGGQAGKGPGHVDGYNLTGWEDEKEDNESDIARGAIPSVKPVQKMSEPGAPPRPPDSSGRRDGGSQPRRSGIMDAVIYLGRCF